MRPSDMDAIARVVAQQVKEIVDKKLAAQSQPEMPDLSHYDAQLKALTAENVSLSEQVRALVDENQNLTKTVGVLVDRIENADTALNERFNCIDEKHNGLIDTVDAVALTVASCVKVDDHVGVVNSIEARITDIDIGLGEVDKRVSDVVKDAVTLDKQLISINEMVRETDEVVTDIKTNMVHVDGDTVKALRSQIETKIGPKEVATVVETMWDQDLKNQVAAMLPDEVDVTKAVGMVHELVMTELPEMVAHATPEIDVEAVNERIEEASIKWLNENRATLVGPKGDKGDTPDAPTALPPTDLQVIEAVKAVYPSIRQDLVRRLPAMQHKGVWNPETQYDVGDEVIKNGSTYRLMEPSTDEPPADAWQMTSQGKLGKKGAPGRDGDKGERGDKGDAGIGIEDMVLEDTMLVVQLTDGNVKTFDLSEFIEKIISRMGET